MFDLKTNAFAVIIESNVLNFITKRFTAIFQRAFKFGAIKHCLTNLKILINIFIFYKYYIQPDRVALLVTNPLLTTLPLLKIHNFSYYGHTNKMFFRSRPLCSRPMITLRDRLVAEDGISSLLLATTIVDSIWLQKM